MSAKHRITGLVSLGLALSMGLAGCSSSSSGSTSTGSTTADSTEEKVIHYGMSTAWDSLNPYGSASGSIYQQLVMDALYDRLAYVDEGGSAIEPRGAESWSSNEDGTVITWNLDKNATWHDGQPVTAADWEWTLLTVTDSSFEWGMKSELKFLAGTDDSGNQIAGETLGIKAVDDYTLEMTLKSPMAAEDWILLHNKYVYVLPEHLLSNIAPADINSADFWKSPVGSGPCTFISELTGSQIELATNQNYHLGAPKFDKLVITVIANSNIVNAFLAGEIDAFNGSTSVDELAAAEAQGYQIVKSELPTGVAAFLINNVTITDHTVRQALSMAMDKDLLIQQALNGDGVASATAIIPGTEWDNGTTWKRDVEGAKQLLADSDWWQANNRTLKLACTSSRSAAAAILQQNFAEIGITIEIETVDFTTMTSGLKDNKYDLGICGTSAMNYPLWMQGYYDYRNATYCNIQDQHYAELQEAIEKEMDPAQKKTLVNEYQDYLYEQMPLVIMYHSYSSSIMPNRLVNYNPFDSSMNNQKIWKWEIAE